MKTTCKIVIVDDHNLILEGLASLIQSIDGFELTGQFNSVGPLLASLDAGISIPDLFVLDIEMPGSDGIQAAKCLKERLPNSKILMLTMHEESYYINRAVMAGASGYLLKNSTRKAFENTVARILAGEQFVCERPVPQRSMVEVPTSDADQVTAREMHVLKLIAQGKSSKDIGSALFISSRTVDTHRNNLKRKLGLRTSGELVRYAFD